MLGGYLVGTWMLGLMPASYYSFAGGIDWKHVLLQLLLQDLVQYVMHMAEHKVSRRMPPFKQPRKLTDRLFDPFPRLRRRMLRSTRHRTNRTTASLTRASLTRSTARPLTPSS